MFKRRSTRPGSTDASAYSRRAAAADSLWDAQDRARTAPAGAYRAAREEPLDPRVERIAFPVQEKVVWPLEDRTERMGPRARALSFGAVVLVAAAAGVAGLIWAAPDGPHNAGTTPVATTAAPVADVEAAPEKPAAADPARRRPRLQGRPGTAAASEVDPAKAIVKSAPAASSTSSSSTRLPHRPRPPPLPRPSPSSRPPPSPAPRPAPPRSPSPATSPAPSSSTRPAAATARCARPSGRRRRRSWPRRCCDGRRGCRPTSRCRRRRSSTSSRRPPTASVYPVSVSLLRVGVTSELRLEMEQLKGKDWRVTNVLG